MHPKRLRKSPHPDPVGSATYYFTQAGHRETAIDGAIHVLRDACEAEIKAAPSDDVARAFSITARDWVIESLIQGAWIREYHSWEVATKEYFDDQHLRDGGAKVEWKAKPLRSHVARVKEQLAAFSASVPDEVIETIDQARRKINTTKHKAELLVAEAGYRELVTAIANFWSALASQEA